MDQRKCLACDAVIREGAISCAHCGAEAPSRFGPDADARETVEHDLSLMHPDLVEHHDLLDGPFVALGDILIDPDPLDMFQAEAAMARPERDANGKIIWDPKHALIGGLVIALTVAFCAWVYWPRPSIQPARASHPAVITTTVPR